MSFIESFLTPENLRNKLKKYLQSAGIKTQISSILTKALIGSFFLSFIFLLFFRNNLRGYSGGSFILGLVSYWILSILIAVLIIGFAINLWISLKKYNRKKSIEDVLADYLQLVAANVGAGMPIDQAMWYAVRSRFGTLAHEIEIVAKKSISGVDLPIALKEFSDKYDSELLKKSMTLLVEGLEAGGEVASLITQISLNIKESQIREKEMRSNVLSYSIFISFAALVASPFLFALSQRIVIVMADVTSKIDFSTISTVSSNTLLKGGGSGITADEFKKFAYIALSITSSISAMIVSTVRKGSIKAGIKLIPIFLIVSIALFLILSLILGFFFGGLTA